MGLSMQRRASELSFTPFSQRRVPLDGSPSEEAAAFQTPGHTAEVREKKAAGAEADLNFSRKELWRKLLFFSLPVAPPSQVLVPLFPPIP